MIKGINTINQYKIAQYIEEQFEAGCVTMEPLTADSVQVTDQKGGRLVFYMEEGQIKSREAMVAPELMEQYIKQHRAAFERWPHGEITHSWRDKSGVLCARYADGEWYHYKEGADGLVWW